MPGDKADNPAEQQLIMVSHGLTRLDTGTTLVSGRATANRLLPEAIFLYPKWPNAVCLTAPCSSALERIQVPVTGFT